MNYRFLFRYLILAITGIQISFLVTAFYPIDATALSGELAADKLLINRAENIVEYQGNIRLTTDEFKLSLDKMIIFLQKDSISNHTNQTTQTEILSKIEKIQGSGNIHFRTSEESIKSDELIYDQNKGEIVFLGSVEITKDNIILRPKQYSHILAK